MLHVSIVDTPCNLVPNTMGHRIWGFKQFDMQVHSGKHYVSTLIIDSEDQKISSTSKEHKLFSNYKC